MKKNKVNLFSKCNRGFLVVEVIYEGKKISEYRFQSSNDFNQIGTEIITATLISWATIDLCFADHITICSPIKENVKEYISSNFELVCSTYKHIYKNEVATLNFKQIAPSLKIENIYLDEAKYFLGNTGGRDSTLCRHILEQAGKLINYYTVSYDSAPRLPDGHIDMEVFDAEVYQHISISGIKRDSDIISTHQADDIHVTFAAPYLNVQENMPANLAVGLPWESIHVLSNGCPDLVPTESYASINILINLFKSFGIANFQIVSPIATLHSLGVYSLLSRIIGKKKLHELDSCWNSSSFSGHPCEVCPKCQRLKIIFNYLDGEGYLNTTPTLNIKSADFLFGSLFGYEVFAKYPHIQWGNYCLLDDISLAFSHGFESILQDVYQIPSMDMHSLSIDYQSDQQTWDEILTQIVDSIGLNFNELADVPLHSKIVPFLPYEKDYKWKRKQQILNCYGSCDVYDNSISKWVIMKVCDEGEHLHLPHLPILKKWFNVDVIKKNYPHLSFE